MCLSSYYLSLEDLLIQGLISLLEFLHIKHYQDLTSENRRLHAMNDGTNVWV